MKLLGGLATILIGVIIVLIIATILGVFLQAILGVLGVHLALMKCIAILGLLEILSLFLKSSK